LRIDVEPVIAFAAERRGRGGPEADVEDVVARAPVEQEGRGMDGEDIVAGLAVEPVAGAALGELVVAVAAVELVLANEAVEDVIASKAANDVRFRSAVQRVRAAGTVDFHEQNPLTAPDRPPDLINGKARVSPTT
jgi:hypothetical protein